MMHVQVRIWHTTNTCADNYYNDNTTLTALPQPHEICRFSGAYLSRLGLVVHAACIQYNGI